MTDKDKLSQIKSLIKELSLVDDLWELFHLQFEKLHPQFFNNLKERYPELTRGETRMCGYLMLNMSNKEIATLTKRTLRSVETMRYRLSKKMQLAPDENLISHLNSLCASPDTIDVQ